MGQDDNSDNSYRTGYGGYGRYTGPAQPKDASSSTGQPGQAGQPGQQGQTGGTQQQQGQQWQQQTYSNATYEPPASTQGSSPYDPTSTGMQAKTEALLGYLLGWFSGIIFLFVERKNRFVRFSAAQSTIFFGIVSLFYLLLRLISLIPLLGFLLTPVIGFVSSVVGFVVFLIWVFLMIQAYRGKKVRLPFISSYAENLAHFTFRRKKTV